MAERPAAPTAPELVIETDGGSTLMSPGRVYHVGRDPLSDIVLDDARVSWHHAVLRTVADHWTVEDENSTNGTYTEGRRVHEWGVGPGSVIRFGNPQDGPRAVLVGTEAEPGAAPAARPRGGAPRPDRPSPAAPASGTAPPGVRERGAPSPDREPEIPASGAREPAGPAPGAREAAARREPEVRPAETPPPPAATGAAATSTFRQPTTVRPLPTRTVRIGRAADNDIVIDDLIVSRRHAELRAHLDGRYEIVDLDSHNGTYLNGQPVTEAGISEGDTVGIGHSTFRLVGDELQEFVDSGEISLDVQDLAVTVDEGRKVLLDHVSFPVGEKCLLAVVGPSGAGKSTLLNALTGLRPAEHGTVVYDGRDLYRDYAELRRRIGLVPQDDILHVQLTVRRALGYAAELRFPEDTASAEREARVEEVIRELGLEQRADQPIHSLSGGQRKRVSVALELLTKPSLLFLDEPTSGLDPGMDRSVMHMLRGLADDGRTVIVVTHSVLNLDVCDRLLVMAPGGRIAYFGAPEDALEFFGFDQWPEAFEAFENDHDRDWAGDYRASSQHRQYIALRPQPRAAPDRRPVAAAPPPKSQSWFGQLGTLVRRYVSVLSADRTFIVIMIALPFGMGVMARALAGSKFTLDTTMDALLVLCVGGVLTGAANAVRELVKERVIYRRERAVGLSRSAYLTSKVVVLGSITVVQAVVLTLVGLAGVDLNAPGGQGVLLPPLLEITLAVALLSFTSMMLGLVISALVPKEEVTMPLLVLLTMVQIVFCGALLKLDGVLGMEQLGWLVPARWAFAAMASTVDLARIVPGKDTADPLFDHSASVWLTNLGVMVLLSVALWFVVAMLLRRHEPAVMRK
ncbi:FHA domain-containing protein [Streptomyces sp. WMMC940]|uniref:FHA domain-containing protein n=1 Tax=Streptomyces sp. WMMC940 TaxID=3015153 RepID=UPI0022B61DEB|nr:FHA domain-containing protein [Streptomyces sp. WMMC940]MCZ7457275.1 ATP-binding cassette domain-containing protein [Streptomyces sp. WMMC940]